MSDFDQVHGVSDADRGSAFANILVAAKHYGVKVAKDAWRQLSKRPHAENAAH